MKKDVLTIEDIAKLAGVSKSTVSRALNDSTLIGEETKERIRAIAREHNFQMSIPARRLSMRESRTIAFATHLHACGETISDMFSLEFLGAITTALSRMRYDLLMVNVRSNDTAWISEYLNTGRCDGFILMTSTHKQRHIRALVQINAPFIVWGVPLPNQSYCSVIGDDVAGGRLATEHLLRSGRKRIAFLGGSEDEYEVQRRYQGYANAMQAAGQTIDPNRVVYADYTAETAREVIRQLIQKDPHFDALFCNSDLMALAAISVLQASGRKVPDDVAVIGYDNLSISALTSPGLTTISQNLPLVGDMLANNLIQYLHTGVVTNVTIPVELVIRQTA